MVPTSDLNEAPHSDVSDVLRLPDRKGRAQLGSVGQVLANFLDVMNASGDGAEEDYRAGLEELRKHSAQVVLEATRMESACDTWDYPTRWGLVYAVTVLEDAAALPFLRSVVLTPIPPEAGVDPHSFSTVAEETILRTTAVDGVSQLAREGSGEAIESLFEFLSVPSFSIKRAAVQGLLAAEQGESLRPRIEERLRPDERMLLDIRPLDVSKVAQIESPERHLAEGAREQDASSSPDLPDRRGAEKSSSKKASAKKEYPPRGDDSSSKERED